MRPGTLLTVITVGIISSCVSPVLLFCAGYPCMQCSPTTRALMERDMLVRKFQKENLDDLFAVIRKNHSGMECLARFAEEQRMGGEVGFFMEVEGERAHVRGDSRE